MKKHETAFIAQGAVVLGNVELLKDSSVWYNAVVRADLADISIGEGSNVQECSVLHVDKNFPLKIGDFVTVGHGAILHGCEIGDNTLVGMGAIVLNGAKIGKNCIIGAGALVTGGTVIEDNSLVLGSPAKVRREVTAEEVAASKENADEYIHLKSELMK